MPNFDGTGPRGLGQGRGFGRGPCGQGQRRGFCGRRDRNPLVLDKEEQKKVLQAELEGLKEEKEAIEKKLKEFEDA